MSGPRTPSGTTGAHPDRADVVVRACREQDVPRLTASEPPGADIARRIFARQRDGESVLLVAWLGQDPVGTGELVLGTEPVLRSLHVAQEHRGRGIGSALVRAAEQRARGMRLSLWVGVDNPRARRLYARLGYHGTGEKTTTAYTYVDADGPHEATETDERMVKDLAR